MAINTQTFTNGYNSNCVNSLKTALEGTNLFDSVTLTDSTITCTKNNISVFTINLGIQYSSSTSSPTFITWNNTEGSAQSTNFAWDKGNTTSGQCLNSYTTITTIGNALYAAFSYYHNSAATGMTLVFCLYVGPTNDGNIGIYICKTSTTDGTSLNCYSASTNSYTSVLTTLVSAPVSTELTTVCTYPLTAINKDGDAEVFTGAYGIRYSPPIHTLSRTQVGVTPVKLTIKGVQYLTDGVIMIENSTS